MPRGGGIFKEDWWKLWEDKRYPENLDMVIASLDPAYTAKDENDPSGFTVWGTFIDPMGHSKIILMEAWRKRLELHGPHIAKIPSETAEAYKKRTQGTWGLIEWVADSCRRFKVDALLIESKASGLSVAQEIRRLYANDAWGVTLIDPKSGDKVARAYSVQHLFSEGLVFAPDRDWAQIVIDEMRDFPKAPHDDLVDSATQALSYLRKIGLAVRRDEWRVEQEELAKYRPAVKPLYPMA